MQENITVTLVANAGIVLAYKGKKILLDGLFHAANHEANPFSNIPAPVWQRMLSGVPPYDHISCLLFTHNHEDHFSPTLTLEYLQRQAVQAAFLPPDEGGQKNLRSYLMSSRIPFLSLETVASGQPIPLESGITVTPYRTRHVDKAFLNTPHYCYLISCDEKKLLFTADVDYTYEIFPELRDVPLRAVFVNPLFFGALENRRFFKGSLQTESLCIYHVPFPEDDIMQYRAILTQCMDRWTPHRGELLLLERSGQQLIL